LGERLPGYIKAIREDGKIDVIISQHSSASSNGLEDQILDYLKSSGGESDLTDKSNPDLIYSQFKVSKKKYKNALGALYKRKMIVITREKISLAQANDQADKQTKVQAKEKPKAQPKKSSSIWG
jgi:predicted RNA-binding protein (virulence factor B family)